MLKNFFFVNNPDKKYLAKIRKTSKIGHEKKKLISAFSYFLKTFCQKFISESKTRN